MARLCLTAEEVNQTHTSVHHNVSIYRVHSAGRLLKLQLPSVKRVFFWGGVGGGGWRINDVTSK